MVQTTQSVRPCLRKPHLPTIDLDKLVEEAKDVKWFEWDGDPVHKDDAQKQFPHRLFASDAWDLHRLQEYQSLVKEIPEISQIVKGLRTSLGQDEDGTEGNEIDDLYGIDGFTEYFDLSGKSAVAVYLYLAQALATFPAAQHFPGVRLRAAEAHPPPPESGLAPDALRRPACTVSLGDFVMVDIPPGYDKHTVDRWEHDGTTPHFLVAQVQELFVDAAGAPRFAGRWFFTRSETSLRWRHGPQPVRRFGQRATYEYTAIGHNAEAHAMFRMQDQCPTGSLPEQLFPACPTDDGLWFEVPCCLPLAAIARRVEIVYKPPEVSFEDFQQQLAPSPPDFWWQFEFGYHFMSFTSPAAEARRVFELHNGKRLQSGHHRQINCLEVYAGAGGTSFVANQGGKASITTRWAVDIFDDAVMTFATNHPETACYHMGVEEFMILVLQWQHLWDNYHIAPAAARVNARHRASQRQRAPQATHPADSAAAPADEGAQQEGEEWERMLPPAEGVREDKRGLLERLGMLHPLEHARALGKKRMPLAEYDRAQKAARQREQRQNTDAEKREKEHRRAQEVGAAALDGAPAAAGSPSAGPSAGAAAGAGAGAAPAGVASAAAGGAQAGGAVVIKRFRIKRVRDDGRSPPQRPEAAAAAAATPRAGPSTSAQAVKGRPARAAVPVARKSPQKAPPPVRRASGGVRGSNRTGVQLVGAAGQRRQVAAAEVAESSSSDSSSTEDDDDGDLSDEPDSDDALDADFDAELELPAARRRRAALGGAMRGRGRAPTPQDGSSSEEEPADADVDADVEDDPGGEVIDLAEGSGDAESVEESDDEESSGSEDEAQAPAQAGRGARGGSGGAAAAARRRPSSSAGAGSVPRFRGAGRSGSSDESSSETSSGPGEGGGDSGCSGEPAAVMTPGGATTTAAAGGPSGRSPLPEPAPGSGVPTSIPRVTLTPVRRASTRGRGDGGDAAVEDEQAIDEDPSDGPGTLPDAAAADEGGEPATFRRFRLARVAKVPKRGERMSAPAAPVAADPAAAQRPPQPRRSAKAALAVPAAAPASATQDPAGEVAASAPQVRRVRLSRAPRSAPKAKSGAAARRGSRGCSSRGAGGSRGTAAVGPRRIADFSDDDDDGQAAQDTAGRRGGRVRFGRADVTEYDPTAAELGDGGAACAVVEYGDAESGDSDGTDRARLPAAAVDSCGELYDLPMPLKVAYEDVGSKEEVEKIVDMRLVEVSERQGMGQGEGQIKETLREGDYNLLFRVRFAGRPPSQDEWRTEADLGDAGAAALHVWVHHVRNRMLLPLRGDCNLITGGPPCQSVSGNNRNALSDSILHDPRNRQLLVYVRLIEVLQPSFVLLEQVLDILLKENGVYVKAMTANLVRMGYQAHTGTLITGAYGCPQGRVRVIMLAAKSTEPLPPFPEPTHLVRQFNRTQVTDSVQCNVGFTSEAAVAAAHDPVLIADAISDLPAVRNFHSSDAGVYRCLPETPYQVFMRRAPPPWAAGAAERAEVGDSLVKPILSYLNDFWCKEIKRDGLALAGRSNGVVVGGGKSSRLSRTSLPTPARNLILSALHDHLARTAPPAAAAAAAPDPAPAAAGSECSDEATTTAAAEAVSEGSSEEESVEAVRARNADARRRNILRHHFGLMALAQRRVARNAAQQPPEAPRAAPARVRTECVDCWGDSGSDAETVVGSDEGDGGCGGVEAEAAAGRVAKGVLAGRARGELPIETQGAGAAAEAAGEDVYAGRIERLRRRVQLSDMQHAAEASWRLAAAEPPRITDVRLRDVPSHAERAGLTRFLPELREAVAAGDDSDAASEVSSDDATGAAGAGGCGAACTDPGKQVGPSSAGAPPVVADATAAAAAALAGDAAGVPMHSGPGGGLEPATTGGSAATAAASDERFALNNLDIAASAADGAAKSEARAEAANRVREALQRGSAAAADVPGCSDDDDLGQELNLQRRTAPPGVASDGVPSRAPAASSKRRQPLPGAQPGTTAKPGGGFKRMRGAGTDPHDSMHVLDGEAAGTANDTAGALASSSGTAQDAATAPALTEVGSAATGVTHGAPLTVAPACPAAASAQPRCVATEAQARHAALLSRVTACGRAAGPAHEAAKASALLSDSDDGSDAEEGIAFTGDVGDARDAPLEDNTPAAVTAEQPASAMHAGGDRSSRPGADVGVGEHMHGGAARSAGAASGDGDPDTDGAEARTLSARKMETLLEPCLRMFGFPGAVEAMVRADGSVDAVAEAAAELPPLRGAAGGQGLGEEEKEEWAERGLRVLAQYEVEAQGWQDARARVQWQRVLAEPPFEDWDRKVCAEACGSLLDEKSRLLYILTFIMARQQRHVQAGLQQLAAVAEYSATLTGPVGKACGWQPPRDGEAPFVPTRPVSEPHIEGLHDAVTKPLAARAAGHAVLSYSRHTKPGQRLQLVDVGRRRDAVPLEELQPWRAAQPPLLGWQLAAAAEAFAAAGQAVRAHLPHACNTEDEMRMAAVPRCSSRYLQLSNHNFRDWPGVTTNADGSVCCGHFHAYIKREGKQLISGCPSFREGASVQLPGLYTMPGTTRTHDSRVDTNLRGAVTVVTQAPGCASRTVLLSTGRLLCPRYAATFKVGHASGHQGCFGRVSPLALMPTVVTRPEPHNLCIVHPTQDRVLTPRENARFQGFPDYYYIASTGSIAKGENDVAVLEALAPNKPLPVQLQAAMKLEHAGALQGGPRARRTTTSRFRLFNANRYLQTGNAVSPVLSAAIGRSIVAACSGESHVHHPVQAVPDLEWEAAIATARRHGLLSTYQELTLWAEAFQRQQALGHELHRAAEAPGGVAGADEFRAPPMERLRAAAAARQALDAAMHRGDAPDGSEECVRLRQAAEPTVHPGDVAIPAAAAVRIQGRAEGRAVVAALEDHADTLATQGLQHMQHAADAGAFRLPGRGAADAGHGDRWSDAGSAEDDPDGPPHACPTPDADPAAGSATLGATAGTLSPANTAQENVPPPPEAAGSPGGLSFDVEARVKGSCIADTTRGALVVERASSRDVARLVHPGLAGDSSDGGEGSVAERAAAEVRGMATLQPAAAGCVLRRPPPPALRAAAAAAQKLPRGSVDVPHAWLGHGSAYSLRRRRPVLAQLSAQQAQRAREVLQQSIPPEVLQQLLSDSAADAAEGRRRLHGCMLDGATGCGEA